MKETFERFVRRMCRFRSRISFVWSKSFEVISEFRYPAEHNLPRTGYVVYRDSSLRFLYLEVLGPLPISSSFSICLAAFLSTTVCSSASLCKRCLPPLRQSRQGSVLRWIALQCAAGHFIWCVRHTFCPPGTHPSLQGPCPLLSRGQWCFVAPILNDGIFLVDLRLNVQ